MWPAKPALAETLACRTLQPDDKHGSKRLISAAHTVRGGTTRTLVDGDIGCEQRLNCGRVPVLNSRVKRLAAVQQLLLLRDMTTDQCAVSETGYKVQ